MRQKKVLIDLTVLRHPFCGLGQIALNYGRWFQQHAPDLADEFHFTLLVPKNYMGKFGNHVSYIKRNDLRRQFPLLMPRFDVWHAINQMSAFRPWSRTTRYIITIHDVNFIHEKADAKQRKYRRRLQRRCDRASEFCFISQFAMDDTRRVLDLGGKPARVIYNGVEDLTIGDQARPQNLPEGPFFLALGEVKAKKNLHTLLPMMDRLKDHRLVIAGNDAGHYADQLRASLPQHPNVSMLGLVSNQERRWLYAHCQALLFPSTAEGFGLPIIEAMQWGKPVFCSTFTSIPEIGGPHAHYFTDFDPDAMARLVSQGLRDFTPQKAEQEQAYAATFSYERHLAQYIELYRER